MTVWLRSGGFKKVKITKISQNVKNIFKKWIISTKFNCLTHISSKNISIYRHIAGNIDS